MNYDGIWVPAAERDLINIWLAATDRNSVTECAHLLDQQLGRNPLDFGESRVSSVHRIAFEPPLAIEFEVIEDDRRVRVLHVWRAQ
jgi:hypothetical protein